VAVGGRKRNSPEKCPSPPFCIDPVTLSRIAAAFRRPDYSPYRVSTTTGVRAFFRSLDDARRAAEILQRLGYRVAGMHGRKIKAGWQAYGQDS
jgi:hypothetical protein